MAAFLFKVFTLTIRTVSKPLATRVQNYVINHPTLRKPVIELAQAIHRMEVRVTRGAEGKSGKVYVGNLSEENALDLAGKVISESFVWGVAIAVVGIEYNRQARKDIAKAAKEKAYQEKVERDERWLNRRIDEVQRDVIWLKERTVLIDAQLAAILDRTRQEEDTRQLKRSNSYWGVFGLSR